MCSRRATSSSARGVGQGDVDEVEELLEHGVAGGGGLLEALAVAEAGPDVVGQLGDGVELRCRLGEVVVELGELLLLDRGDADLDLDVLALEVAAGQRAGEGGAVAGGHAAQRLVEAVEHAALADLVAHTGDLAALDDLAVLAGGQVDDHEVAVGGGALDLGEAAEALAQGLDLLLDVLVGDRDVVDGDREPVSSGRSISGLTSTSAVNSRVSLSSNFVMSISGWASGSSSLACSASTYSPGSASLIASSSTAPRPTWRSMIGAGDLAAAEAGDVDLRGDLLVGASRLGLSSSKGTSTVSFARVGLRVSTVLFTGVSPRVSQRVRPCVWAGGHGSVRSGRSLVVRVSGRPGRAGRTGRAVGATGLEPAVSCSQSRRASHYATPRLWNLRESSQPG